MPNFLKKRKTKNDTDPTWHVTSGAQVFSASLMAIVSLSASAFMDVAQPLADQCPPLYL